MKQSQVFTAAEAAQRVGVAESVIDEWIAGRLIAPSVVADGDQTLFDESDIAVLAQLKNLREIGYDATDIRRIARKVGLPKPKRKKTKHARQYLTVGELAKRSGLNARTIKYWEERGIIEPTRRSEGGFRLYDETYLLFCSLIQDLQNFGYTLEEIKEAADLFRSFYEMKTRAFAGTEAEMGEKLSVMEDRIERLFSRMDLLSKGISRWRKLLREKRAEIGALQKRLSKTATASSKKAKAGAETEPENPS